MSDYIDDQRQANELHARHAAQAAACRQCGHAAHRARQCAGNGGGCPCRTDTLPYKQARDALVSAAAEAAEVHGEDELERAQRAEHAQATRHGAIVTATDMLLRAIGESPGRPGLLATPDRVARAWLHDLCRGYAQDPAEVLRRWFPTDGYDGIVVVRDIPVVSLCEHHLLPFTGVAHIAYMPQERLVGLSKLARVVDVYARRLQVQERLTVQVADALEQALAPLGVLVVVAAEHSCMTLRGVQKPGTRTVTAEARGLMRESESVKAEAYRLIENGERT